MDKNEILEQLENQKESGKKIIGVFPHQMIPEEIIFASGAIPLRLSFFGPEEICMKGTEYLTPATCPLARSSIGFFEDKNPIFALIDGFIGGNYCNGDLCASEYIAKYFNVPLIHFTIPWVNNLHAIKFYKNLLIEFKENLEKITHIQISDEILINSIQIYNQIRKKLQEIVPKIGMGFQFQNILNQLYLLGPEIFLHQFEKKENIQEPQDLKKDIAFTGSYVAIDDFILELIENCGFNIKYNDSESIFYFEKEIPIDDPYSALSEFYLQHHYSSRMFKSEPRIDQLVSKIKYNGIKGIIFHVLKFCDPYIATKKDVIDYLKEQGLVVLELERDYDQNIGQLKTRIEAFKEMLE
ncbi:MAG: 2-hydroxyacyl-CoA dehydratase subunit D [Promethearchaeota archaeon]